MTDDFVPTERELWNTAKIYSVSHVAEPLVRCKKLITVCLFGVEEIGDEYNVPINIINQNKIQAMNRLLQELKELISTNIGFMKEKNRIKLREAQNRLIKVEEVIDGIDSVSVDQRKSETKITLNTQHFNNCLKELRMINSLVINNLSDLIFPSGDELNLDKIKRDIIEGG